MKKTLIAAIVLCALFANVKAETYGKMNYLGINPFGLLFNIYSGEYGRFLDAEGTSEINVPFYFFSSESFTAIGLGAKYRMYKDNNGEGIFYGGGIKFDSWKWTWFGSDNSWFNIKPHVEGGYRWSWPSGWTIAPSLELGYNVSTYEAKSGWGEQTYGAQGLDWGLNLGIAFMF